MKLISTACALLALFFAPAVSAQVNYRPSTEDFPNPERGFYRYSQTENGNDYLLLDPSVIGNAGDDYTSSTANYTVKPTLIFRYFVLKDFTAGPIDQAFLDNMQTDFDRVRAAGYKIIPRFAYTITPTTGTCGSFICPPYGDAPKNIVLGHIAQLKPLLSTNKDVIATVQMGFIGTWGENYYTDFFGDASQGPDFKLTDANWNDRNEVLFELLDAVPVDRMVQVRYPQAKQRAVFGVDAGTGSSVTTNANAYSGSDQSRLGFHNDCLLASPTDFGTYTDYGNSSTGSQDDVPNLKPYFEDDSQFVVVGGETCDDSVLGTANDCAPTGRGDTELRELHYSYLNADFNNTVNNDWEDGGCMDDIKRNLGYRFELQTGTYSDAAAPGQIIDFDLNLINRGYAAPYNSRIVEVILRNTVSDEEWTVELDEDPRTWYAENTDENITYSLCLPGFIPTGDYDLFLNLPDPEPALRDRPVYSIRMANTGVWEAATGYNDLNHRISVTNSGTNAACNRELIFAASNILLPSELGRWTATAQAKSVLLNWETTVEAGSSHFDVERSKDGERWQKIARIKAKGHASAYQYDDLGAEAPAAPGGGIHAGANLYRLRMADADGSFSYSAIRLVSLEGNGELVVYPNPTTGLLRLNGHREVTVMDVRGKVLLRVSGEVIDLGGLPAGVYFLRGGEEVVRVVRY